MTWPIWWILVFLGAIVLHNPMFIVAMAITAGVATLISLAIEWAKTRPPTPPKKIDLGLLAFLAAVMGFFPVLQWILTAL
jgi:hypothetical protein